MLDEADLTFYSKKNNLSFLFYFNDKAVINFNKLHEALYDKDYKSYIDYHDESERAGLVLQDTFSNIFSTGFEKEIEFKNIIKFNLLNFKFILSMPFSNDYSFFFIPYIKVGGDYFFGFNWLLNESFIIEIYPHSLVSFGKYTQSTYLKLAYEFFRFYGPKKFRWTIYMDDTLDFKFSSSNTLTNEFNAGVYFSLFGFKPIIYYLVETYCDAYPFEVTNNYVGFNVGLEYEIKWFLISISYEGKIDHIPDEDKIKKFLWISQIDCYFRFKMFF